MSAQISKLHQINCLRKGRERGQSMYPKKCVYVECKRPPCKDMNFTKQHPQNMSCNRGDTHECRDGLRTRKLCQQNMSQVKFVQINKIQTAFHFSIPQELCHFFCKIIFYKILNFLKKKSNDLVEKQLMMMSSPISFLLSIVMK